MFRTTLQTVHEALTSEEESSGDDAASNSSGVSSRSLPMFYVAPKNSSVDSEDSFDESRTARSSSLTDHIISNNKATSTSNHGVTMVTPKADIASVVKVQLNEKV